MNEKFIGITLIVLLFSTIPVNFASAWWNDEWTRAAEIRIEASQVDGDLSDFPVLIRGNGLGLQGEAQNDCDDIAFVDSTNTTQFSHEIENCELATSDDFNAWVKVPSVSSSTDTTFYMYWGNPIAANQEDVFNTWEPGFVAVYHLHNDLQDSSGNGHHLTNVSTLDAQCQIADCQRFNRTANSYLLGDSENDVDNIWDDYGSFVAWIRMDYTGGSGQHDFFSKNSDTSNGFDLSSWGCSAPPSGDCDPLEMRVDKTGSDATYLKNSPAIGVETWSHLAARWNSTGSPTAYPNGVLDGVGTGSWTDGSDGGGSYEGDEGATFTFGKSNSTAEDDPMAGYMDEIWIYDGLLNNAYVNSAYENQKNGSTWASFPSTFETGGTPSFNPSNFTIGNQQFNQTNTELLQDILFERNDINDTHTDLYVKYPNDFNTTCNLSWQFALMNNTYSNLDTASIGDSRVQSTFTFVNSTNDIITVYCFNENNTAEDGTYVLTIFDFPLLQQIANFRDGTYGTQGQFGALDLATLFIIIVSMIGFNRVNESVGVVFNVFILGVAAFFNLITIPTALLGGLILTVIVVVVSTRKD